MKKGPKYSILRLFQFLQLNINLDLVVFIFYKTVIT